MARLTATEQRRLGVLRPEAFTLLVALMNEAERRYGFTLAIPEDGGTRTPERQAAIYADSLAAGGGSSTAYAAARPGTSRHEYGAAFDLHIIAGGSGDAGAGDDDDYRRLAELGEGLKLVAPGLTAGFYFDSRGVGKHDPYHFQLNESLLDSQMRWKTMRRVGIATTLSLCLIAAALLRLARG